MKILSVFLIALLTAGCSTLDKAVMVDDDWRPILDGSGPTLEVDVKACRELAIQAAPTWTESLLTMFSSSAWGAAGGAIVATVLGGVTMGAAVPIGAGMMGLAAMGGEMWETGADYQAAFRTCLRQRGHSVVY